ncbi:MAG: DNA polymerase III subunit delta [Rhabdochlamydiaceae bacterium]
MKFQTSGAFEKHLKESFPDHLAQVYLFISPCDYEKRLWAEHLIGLLKKKDLHLQTTRFDALETHPIVIQDEIRTPSLWGGVRVLFIDQIDKVKPLSPFLDLLNHSAPDVVLIFGATSAKPVAELYQKGKKDLVALDVSEEKPWDKERRLQEWIQDEARKEGKQLPPEVAAELLRHLGTDLATLYQELKKLITFVGDKNILENKDVEAICGAKNLTTGWQLAETLVWKHPIALQDKMGDLGFIFPFLGQVRYHLQLGAQMGDLIERNTPMHELKKHFPSVRSQNLDKFISIATQRGSYFFLNGLLKLYDFELIAKSAPLDLGVAFDLFQIKIYEKTHTSS